MRRREAAKNREMKFGRPRKLNPSKNSYWTRESLCQDEKTAPQLFLFFGYEPFRRNDLVQEEVQNVALHLGGCVLDLVKLGDLTFQLLQQHVI